MSIKTSMNAAPFATSNDSFSFVHSIGSDSSMMDYAKMCILLALQNKSSSFYEKATLIKEKFIERYGGEWRVITFDRERGGSSGNYVGVYLYINYENFTFIILKNK